MPASNKGKRGPGWGKKANNYMMDPLGARASIAKAQNRGVIKESTSGGRYIDWSAKRPKDGETGLARPAKKKPVKRAGRTLVGVAKKRKDHEDDVVGSGLIEG
jgi:hypothetical protein